MSKSERAKQAQKLGLAAEEQIAHYLLKQQFCLHERRYKTKYGEIDLIASFDNTLIFIEVKARRTLELAAFSLTSRQKERLIATAEYYLSLHPHWTVCRFDVFLIAANGTIRHIENAIES